MFLDFFEQTDFKLPDTGTDSKIPVGYYPISYEGLTESNYDVLKNYIVFQNKGNLVIDPLTVTITVDGEYVDLNYTLVPVPFERIRRITGYLVGTMDHWNNAKKAEERDRVKHDVQTGLERL